VLLVCIAISKIVGATFEIGALIVIFTYVAEMVMHKLVDKKLNKE
jgi:hypothetical protein